MSEQVQKLLSQLLKTQLEKKSSRKTDDETSVISSIEASQDSQNDLAKQKNKMVRNQQVTETGLRVSEEEQWAIYRRLIIENASKIFMILLYCVISSIAICKAGIIILTAFQHFLQDMLISAPQSNPFAKKH